jgi:hypothetical protein
MARARYDDDDDEFDVPSIKKKELSGFDGMFSNTSMPILVIFAFCCNGIALILGVIGLVVCTDPKAKSNALVVTVIAGITTAIGTVVRFSSLLQH